MNALNPLTPQVVVCKCARPPRKSPEGRAGKPAEYQLVFLPLPRGETVTWLREMECPYLRDCWFCPHK
ncbi:hypothetical protein [Neomegalonema sp.]|uniref:hypothetical protein n=1 Tax=Neomegalonema sp. TaxID=2039713 RepID=UPI0026353468|nr:hypothetical protein [Neomegalonema sp.]MDD2867187.1 hypothetical protein [Neomegalonema sp.]